MSACNQSVGLANLGISTAWLCPKISLITDVVLWVILELFNDADGYSNMQQLESVDN